MPGDGLDDVRRRPQLQKTGSRRCAGSRPARRQEDWHASRRRRSGDSASTAPSVSRRGREHQTVLGPQLHPHQCGSTRRVIFGSGIMPSGASDSLSSRTSDPNSLGAVCGRGSCVERRAGEHQGTSAGSAERIASMRFRPRDVARSR